MMALRTKQSAERKTSNPLESRVLCRWIQAEAKPPRSPPVARWADVGSDGGGSIRTPDHFAGLCGLKPKHGRIPSQWAISLPAAARRHGSGVVDPWRALADPARALSRKCRAPILATPSRAVPIREIAASDLRGLRIGVIEHQMAPHARNSLACAATNSYASNHAANHSTWKNWTRPSISGGFSSARLIAISSAIQQAEKSLAQFRCYLMYREATQV